VSINRLTDKEIVVNIRNRKIAWKKNNTVISDGMSESGRHYTKWLKLSTERRIQLIFT
jgi:hypothetical protein